VKAIQETDVFRPILGDVERMCGRKYGASPADDSSMRIIVDHARALTFALAEGVFPSNEGRGYVLRRILRRASRRGRGLGLADPFLFELSGTVVATMGEAYPELRAAAPSIERALRAEEERFLVTLAEGIARFEEVAAGLAREGERVIPGTSLFALYDTYGFPVDMIEEMAAERGLDLDRAGFEGEMEAQRERSRGASRFSESAGSGPEWIEAAGGAGTEFVGYEALEADARVRRYRPGSPRGGPAAAGGRGTPVEIVLDRTPFYAESGGQVGDIGVIEGPGFRAEVQDTVLADGEHVHLAAIVEGGLDPGALAGVPVRARVDEASRRATMRNHTATHLLHAALRGVLGPHATQAGSLVAPDRFRFDFTHFKGMTRDEIRDVESAVNREVLADHPVVSRRMAFADAMAAGAMALFGEKYGDQVRMVEVPGVSRELCGGTHVGRTGEIGPFRILSEGSVASGTRRIEATTGTGALEVWSRERETLEALSGVLQAGRDDLLRRVQGLIEERDKMQKQVRAARKQGGGDLDRLLAGGRDMDGFRLVAGEVGVEDIGGLREMGDALRERMKSGVAVLGARIGDGATFLVLVTDDLVSGRGLRADAIVREVARIAGGSGGGKPHMAQAGCKDPALLPDALGQVGAIVTKLLSAG
jgi:alanyl-tRNA synthetase